MSMKSQQKKGLTTDDIRIIMIISGIAVDKIKCFYKDF